MKNESVVKPKSKFSLGNLRVLTGETVSQGSENHTKEVGGNCVHDLGDMPPLHSLVEGYFTHEEEITDLIFLVLSNCGR